MSKREFGTQLECYAVKELRQHGCLIVETNFHCKLGEIDIIAKDQETLIFVEVRYRKLTQYGGASASVDLKKQLKIIKAASLYLQQQKLLNRVDCRFDVFAIQGTNEKFSYDWIKGAFTL